MLRRGLLPLGLAGAYVAFALTFRGPRRRFWQRMTATGLALGSLALFSDARSHRPRVSAKDVVLGVSSAAGLYAIFQVGDRLARRILPGGARDIGDIYALNRLAPKWQIATRLGLVIGPAEELFWRGFVRRKMANRLGTWPSAAVATAAYGGAHLVTGNPTLIGAATVAGLYWSALAAAGMPMAALIVSHITWDIWIFLVAPTKE